MIASVIGATGYTGGELLRLLINHNKIEIGTLTSESYAGKIVSELHPNLNGLIDKNFVDLNINEVIETSDVIFVALPHGASNEIISKIYSIKDDVKLIDLSGDFRFDDLTVYEEWYKIKHANPELNKKAVFGLPELYKDKIKKAKLIANPGCYPTSAILGTAPLLKNKLVKHDIIVDSKSGVSGAGKKLTNNTHFPEANENFSAYGIANHRHSPEIQQEMEKLYGNKVNLSFTPHLVPINRGILTTIYMTYNKFVETNEVISLYREFFKDCPFVRVLDEGKFPQTKAVLGSNYCDIGIKSDKRTGRVIVISAIDNLVKGASGQAIQNMNLMMGFDEKEGLKVVPLYP